MPPMWITLKHQFQMFSITLAIRRFSENIYNVYEIPLSLTLNEFKFNVCENFWQTPMLVEVPYIFGKSNRRYWICTVHKKKIHSIHFENWMHMQRKTSAAIKACQKLYVRCHSNFKSIGNHIWEHACNSFKPALPNIIVH